ncbi:TetR/AcrR family transcriptional regulator [Bradyrhizobium sp. KBS0727]|jgi:AcrR family transcriptional regulator|uniref:TetR/AcrR family transcriptional regulator n=1 Tax=unclassified Bradyrhizobium TaxID=2631580 RepID=UPI00110EFA1F|nr:MULTISPECIES: TetR/AcrR family transcriptional regulator [unclassified Bradyrhizobium]QDW37252.1 TetR/AcrR family transcriptional regulator [Bradyrhizobium sp. KBS0725]QDW43855.1 TetR/AcrR family transcriptional regulator [Bradyrhizobium sp. KBS0727]
MKITQRPSLALDNRRRAKPNAVRSKAPSRALKQSLRADVKSRKQTPAPPISASKSEKSRDAILEAAAKLFGRQGFSATTLRQIASVAKIKAGSIYYYFDSKEAILDEVLDRGLRHVFESVKTAVKQAGTASHRRRIGLAIEAHLVALLETSDFTSANIRIYGQLPEHLKKPHRPLRRAYAKYWDRLFLDARRAGELRADIEIVPLRMFVIGALNWTIEWFRLGSQDAVIKLARRTELLIFEGVRKA